VRDSDRTRPAVHVCEGCGESLMECECGDWGLPDSLKFDDPESEEDE